MRIYRPPGFIKKLFPSVLWEVPVREKNLYFTFDDGPDPDSTPALISELKKLNIKATFFCLGYKAQMYPGLINLLKEQGHSIGNHGFDHLSGWTTGTVRYVENFEKARYFIPSGLIRPPYGRLAPWQQKALIKKGFRIVMWSLLSYDFDSRLTTGKIREVVLANVRPGAILVFHDKPSLKAKVLNLLPDICAELSRQGYKFKPLCLQ